MELSIYDKIADPIAAVERLGIWMARSGMFGCDRPEQGMVLAFICLAERRSPSEIIRDYDIVDGKLRKKSMSALADFRRLGGRHRWIKTGEDGKEAVIQLSLNGESLVSRFTIEDAKRAELIRPRSQWQKSPGNMLRARAQSNGIAMLAPEIFSEGDDELFGQVQPGAAAPALADSGPLPLLEGAAATPVPPAADGERARAIPGLDIEGPPAEAKPPSPDPLSPEPAPESAPAPSKFRAAAGPDGKLNAETVAAVMGAVGDDLDAAWNWLLARKWLQEGETFERLSAQRAQRILDNPKGFLAAVAKFPSPAPTPSAAGGAA